MKRILTLIEKPSAAILMATLPLAIAAAAVPDSDALAIQVPVAPTHEAPKARSEARPEARPEAAPKAVQALVSTTSRWDLPNLDHPRVDHFVEAFQTDRRETYADFLARSGKYQDMIRRKLADRGMPQDLVYLAMIESGFRPEATSPVKAAGLWQFMPETGERYGLEINKAVDERRDPEQATDAALDYLQKLHDRFDSWYLAAAAYNTGENRVGRIMREETGSEKASSEHAYYEIWDRLPKETRDYVPLMIAAARIAKDPAKYGFDHVEKMDPVRHDTAEVPPATKLAEVAALTGTTLQGLEELNPQLRLDRTRNDGPSAIRIPDGSGQKLTRTMVHARLIVAE